MDRNDLSKAPNFGQAFSLFGVNFSLPITPKTTVVGETLTVTADLSDDQGFSISSGLAWLRDLGGTLFRELQNDEEERPLDVVSLELTPKAETTLTLLTVELDDPTSMRLLPPESNVGVTLVLALTLNVGEGFDFPFLKRKDMPSIPDILGQSITIGKHGTNGDKSISFPPKTLGEVIQIAVPITLKIGDSLLFEAEIPFKFDLSRFALSIDHEQGVHLLSNQPNFVTPDLLGLTWTFRGVPKEGGYHYLTLVTKDLNYQLQLAPGASLELAYTEISREPIVFRVTEFVLSPKGLTLAAEIADDPVRLNGLDTKFRFQGSQLRIVENKIQDLTIAGSGPLPPDLVGDAVADIALQFKQVEGGLQLVSGAAQLRGDKPLDCKGTRFQFSIDAMGLKFVYDQKFHLYFALTGQAKFVPEPSDDKNGPLALLPEITLDLVECPLTGDASIIAKYINFLVEFPTPVSFSFLGAYGFELRAIGFLPQCEKFDGRGAMLLSGQVMFAQGSGDVADPKPDLHKLYIGLPPKGETKPQVDMGNLSVSIKAGENFKLSGSVSFKFDATMQGFTGDGVLEITGLPPMAAAFGFMRVRRDADAPWVRAWFIYIEVRQVSFRVPILEFYIREVGLGFGYRFTLVSIKAADEAGDIKQLIRELKALSRTQGDLSKQDRWSVDLEEAGQDPRWTIVLRAMISQMSAAPSPLTWNEVNERKLSNTYLFDAVIAVRSDLTFFMAVRGWLNTNYGTFIQARNDNKSLAPLVSGFVLLSVRQKRFLAHLASNPDGHLGTTTYPLKPPLPEFTKRALSNVQFSATLLIEPGLMHFELGWPNMLRWNDSLGPLTAELRGGFIFRISRTELLIGVSYLARARLVISASINLGLVGANLTAVADAAYGARFIGLIPFDERSLAVYGAIGLELRIQIALSLWIKIPLIFYTIKLSFSFKFEIGFTAGLEVAVHGSAVGLRGRGTISLSVMGHSLQFNVRLGVNEKAVTAASLATEKYMHIGLEATDVETGLPGVDAEVVAAPEAAFALPGAEVQPEISEPAFSAPDYSVFVIRESEADEYSYFVLLPKGETADGTPQRGFLPVPPNRNTTVVNDFALELPSEVAGLQQFDPTNNATPWVEIEQVDENALIKWKANWDAKIATSDDKLDPGAAYEHPGKPEGIELVNELTLQQYLRQAFLVENGNGNNDATLDDVVPIGDPDPIYESIERLEDERVQNPSDGAFEAAVRGAVEQFRGSPLFKHDPNLAYDKALEEAFDPDTTIYDTENPDVLPEANQQAHQIRGLVIHDLVNDLREYVAAFSSDEAYPTESSIPFQMGLVFRVPAGNAPPTWLLEPVDDGPKIYQRVRPEDTEPTPEAHTLHTFNVRQTDFAAHPPQFQRVQHFSDANTIAIAWDLEWEQTNGLTDARAEPEHHLQYYRVRRRPLDGRTPEVVYQVKNASVLHRPGNGSLNSLKPRFQVVDHFNEETLEEQAGLPATGRSYLYNITPVDFCDKLGQPLTLVATRFPNEPPRVPVDGELVVEYRLPLEETAPPPAVEAVEPADLVVTWSEPSNPKEGPTVAIDDYYLIFRREATLPIGSYGLDSSTQRARTGLLPTSNARPLPTDIKVLLVPQGPLGERFASHARLPSDGPEVKDKLLEVLRRAGIFPEERDGTWRPEAWRVFLQTVSTNQVPSALAPVQLLLRARPEDNKNGGVEERHPAELEWLPQPVMLPMLPPEDQRGVSGIAHFPMPVNDDFTFIPELGNVAYQTHPLGLRCIRFRWNQGPSHLPDYPLDLTAGYELLELDVDAHTSDTFADPERLQKALRRIQEVQMLPADDLLLAPGDTLSANQWEAWYPSAILRRQAAEPPLEGSELEEGPWYSWRESILEWPEWPGLTDLSADQVRAPRPEALHPLLRAVTNTLGGQPLFSLYVQDELSTGPLPQPMADEFTRQGLSLPDPLDWTVLMPDLEGDAWQVKDSEGNVICKIIQENAVEVKRLHVFTDMDREYIIDLQTSPPFQPQDFDGLLESTDPDGDPYGWSVLQRFGLAVAFSLHQKSNGELVLGQDLLEIVNEVLDHLQATHGAYYKHLHVELLFQPGRRVELKEMDASADALLGILQLSLRPSIKQVLKYGRVEVQGPAGKQVHLTFTFSQPFSLIDQSDPASGQAELEPAEAGQDETFTRTITFPADGVTNLLLRGEELPTVELDSSKPDKNDGVQITYYRRVDVQGPAGQQVHLAFTYSQPFSLLDQSDPAREWVELEPAQEGQEETVERTITLPANGRTNLLLRGEELPTVELDRWKEIENNDVQFAYHRWVEVQGPAGKQVYLIFTFSQPFSLILDVGEAPELLTPSTSPWSREITLPPNGRAELLLRGEELPTVKLDPEKAVENENVRLIQKFTLYTDGFDATAPFSTYFTRSAESLAEAFEGNEQDWKRFRRYAEALTPLGSEEPHIEVKTDADGLQEQLPAYLAWAQRFFDASAPVETGGDGLTQTVTGPWLATAYPRVATPALVAPDDSGRLTYDHLLQDKWAHTYRYYIRPYDRYRLLWQSLLTSPVLFPKPEERVGAGLAQAQPDPAAGGLDVVLDRTQPVDMPLVLNSARLDPPSTPGQPAVPGTTWEVIVARHPEQALIERNQTLARQLSFRQVAFTLLRRFAYHDWLIKLDVDEDALKWIENVLPDGLPESYPERPDHVVFDPDSPLPENIACSLDLPQRIGNFQQGALVLQWEALPFFYEHRLLLVAQTASTVSPVNQVTQRDFEYRSPDLFDESRFPAWMASVEGRLERGVNPGPPFVGPDSEQPELGPAVDLNSRLVQIPLHRFWDCLPEQAQEQWAAEKPSPDDGSERKPGSLPDPEVVYQILEIREGNLELQVEFYFDQEAGAYAVRQLGKRFLSELVELEPPATQQADYVLHTVLREVSEVTLGRAYDESEIDEPTRHKIAFDADSGRLSVLDVLTRQDHLNILLHSSVELWLLAEEYDLLADYSGTYLDQLAAFLDEWYAARLVTIDAPELPSELAGKVDYIALDAYPLIALIGPLDEAQSAALLALAEDSDVNLKAALERLADAPPQIGQWVVLAAKLLASSDIPEALRSNASVAADKSELTWTGPMTMEQKTALENLIGQRAAEDLQNQLIRAELEEPYTLWAKPPTPDTSSLEGKFAIDTALEHEWTLSWTGPMSDDDVEALLGLEDDENFQVGIRSLIEKVLSGQAWDIERLKQAADAAQAEADAAKANEDPNVEELQAQADDAKKRSANAEAVLNAASAKYAELTSTEPSGAITPAELTNPLQDTTFTVKIPWRVTADHVKQILGPEQASRMTLPPAGAQLSWENVYDLHTSDFVASVDTGLNEQYPAIEPFPVILVFTQAFESLVHQIENAQFIIDYRPMQSDCREELKTQLILRGKLIHAKGPLSAEERETLLDAFPDESNPDRTSVQRLLDDLSERDAFLSDKDALDRLYNGWFVQEPVSEEVSLGELPEDLQALVDFVQSDDDAQLNIRYHGVMTPEEGETLKALFDSPEDKEAIERLYARSVSRGLYGSELTIMARRGGAAPSEMRPLEANPLTE